MKKFLLLAVFGLVLLAISGLMAQQPTPHDATASAASSGDLLPPPTTSNFYQGRPLYRIGDDKEMRPPEVISAPDPPPLKDFRPATVVLWCVVDQDGKIHMVKVARRVGMEAEMKAVQNLQQWKFKPAEIKKNPVDVLMTVEVVWH